jgi:hypothetical protein
MCFFQRDYLTFLLDMASSSPLTIALPLGCISPDYTLRILPDL